MLLKFISDDIFPETKIRVPLPLVIKGRSIIFIPEKGRCRYREYTFDPGKSQITFSNYEGSEISLPLPIILENIISLDVYDKDKLIEFVNIWGLPGNTDTVYENNSPVKQTIKGIQADLMQMQTFIRVITDYCLTSKIKPDLIKRRCDNLYFRYEDMERIMQNTSKKSYSYGFSRSVDQLHIVDKRLEYEDYLRHAAQITGKLLRGVEIGPDFSACDSLAGYLGSSPKLTFKEKKDALQKLNGPKWKCNPQTIDEEFIFNLDNLAREEIIPKHNPKILKSGYRFVIKPTNFAQGMGILFNNILAGQRRIKLCENCNQIFLLTNRNDNKHCSKKCRQEFYLRNKKNSRDNKSDES